MIKLKYISKNADINDVSIKPLEVFLKFNENLIAQVVKVEKNKYLFKPAKTKTRAEVSGGGRKPWRQKGTGNARAGSIRSPLFRGGGVIFGPSVVNKSLSIPKKMKKLAFYQIMTQKAQMGDLIILDTIKIESKKTKDAEKLLFKICPNQESFLIISSQEKKEIKPWRNLALTECKEFGSLKISDIISSKKIILSNEIFKIVKNEIEK